MNRQPRAKGRVVLRSDVDDYGMLFFPVVAVAAGIALWKVSGIAPRIAIVVAFALVAVVMIRGSHRRIEVTSEFLTVVGITRTIRLGWHDIEFCDADTRSIILWSTDGKMTRIYGFRRMLGGSWNGNNRDLEEVMSTIQSHIPAHPD